MKVLQLTASNIKRLVAVDITPNGNVVNITGKNGHGKTSVLDAIWWALAGATNIQEKPIRDGATEGKIRLQLGDKDVELVVTRTFKVDAANPKGYTTSLKVEGNVAGSPQTLLDSFLSSLTFDPMEFMRMSQQEQYNLFAGLVPGLDVNALDAANSIDFSNRADHNKRVKQARDAANKIDIPANAPIVRVDETALVQQIADAATTNAQTIQRQANRDKYKVDVEAARVEIATLNAEIQRLSDRIHLLTDDAVKKEQALATAQPLPPLVDVTDVQRQIEEAKRINAIMDLRDTKTKYDGIADAAQKAADELTAAMEARKADKNAKIAAAKIPVTGITFGDGVILFNGKPLSQASDAEQIRVSCAIAMAKNPKLRVVRVRQGSLIDEDGKKLLAEIAEKNDFQVWMEVVDGSGKVGFVMEDGHVRNAEAPAAAPQQQSLATEEPVPAAAGGFPYGKKLNSTPPSDLPLDIL